MWRGCGMLLVLGVVSTILVFTELRAQAAERDARAPIVIPTPMSICQLSPNGEYLYVAGVEQAKFYDLPHQQWVDIPQESVLNGPGGRFWLRDNLYFAFHTWREEHTIHDSWRVPTDGYVIDVTHRIVTDTLTLPVSEQMAILALAAERELVTSRDIQPFTAPNGQYMFWDFLYSSATIHNSNGASNDPKAVTNKVQGHPAVYPCLPGWRVDSQGYYFIDGAAPMVPNPVRLLLTHPPFPLWLWIWRAIGVMVSLVLVGVIWRVRPQ